MDEQSGKSSRKEVMDEGIGESKVEELVPVYQNKVDEKKKELIPETR